MNEAGGRRRALSFAAVVGLTTLAAAAAAFAVVVKWMVYEFALPRNDLAHGWLIPLISLYLVWRRRRDLRAAAAAPDLRGLAAVTAGLLLFWLGHRGGQLRLSQVAVIWEVWAVPYALYGAGVARLMVFPAAYLLFCVPLGFLDFVTTPLRSATVETTASLLRGMGIAVAREANGLRAIGGSGFQLDVSDPCSGLYSLYGIGALTCAYAFTTLQGRLRQWLLFLSAVPLAIIGNSVRIFTIVLMAHFFGNSAATEYYHDLSPWVIYLVAFLLMFRFAAWLKRRPQRRFELIFEARGRAPAENAHCRKPPAWRLRDKTMAAAVPLLLVVMLVLQGFLPPPRLDSADFIKMALPESVVGRHGDEPLFCHNEQCLVRTMRSDLADAGGNEVCPHCGGALFRVSLGESEKLPSDTMQVKRVYRDPGGLVIDVSVVLSGGSRMSIHRPELCIPAQGFHISRTRVAPVDLPGREPLQVHMVEVEKGEARFVLCYWFMSGNFETASHVVRILRDAWARSVHNRINRWAMCAIVVNRAADAPGTSDIIAAAVRDVHGGIVQDTGGGDGFL